MRSTITDGVGNETLVLRRFAQFDRWPGWAPLAFAVDSSGSAVVACGREADIGRVSAGAGHASISGLTESPWPVAVYRWHECQWQQVLSAEVDVLDPHVLSLPCGSIVVVGSHAARSPAGEVECNALLFESAAATPSRFTVGDGILDVQDSPTGEIWIAYTDEGVMGDYGRRGWGRLSPDVWVAPLGEPGLARRSAVEGHQPVGYDVARGTLAIAGCHALNVWGGDVWLTYHPGFPLVVLSAGRRRSSWANPFPSAIDAFAVYDERVVAHAGPRRGAHRAWLGQLGAGGATRAREMFIRLDDDSPLARLRRVVGRGSVLHAFTDDAWYRADLRSL